VPGRAARGPARPTRPGDSKKEATTQRFRASSRT
jgi:hypothetical protein